MFRSVLASVLLLLPVQAIAQACGTENLLDSLSAEDSARLDALVAQHPYPHGILFRAVKADSDVTVVGTIHIPDPRLQPIVEQVRDAVAEADVLILEATTADQAGLQAFATERPELFFFTEGPTLIDLLSEEEWAQITGKLSAIGVPGFLAAKFKPWYLGMTLAIPPCILSEITGGGKGLDARLEAIARDAGVDIATLDDVESLLQLLAGDPLEDQLDGLRLSLELQGDGDVMTSTLVESYFQGRIRETWELGRIMIEDSGIDNATQLFEDMNAEILVGRNADWEPQIIELVEGKDAVLAVGAAHLSGESGVLRALERAGYEISAF